MAAKQIIILDQLGNGRFRYVLWAAVPVARQPFYANASATSAWTGASAAEILEIQTGAVAEKVETLAVDGLTIQQAQTAVQALFTQFQTHINAYDPWNRYGSFYDGSSWTAGGVS